MTNIIVIAKKFCCEFFIMHEKCPRKWLMPTMIIHNGWAEKQYNQGAGSFQIHCPEPSPADSLQKKERERRDTGSEFEILPWPLRQSACPKGKLPENDSEIFFLEGYQTNQVKSEWKCLSSLQIKSSPDKTHAITKK